MAGSEIEVMGLTLEADTATGFVITLTQIIRYFILSEWSYSRNTEVLQTMCFFFTHQPNQNNQIFYFIHCLVLFQDVSKVCDGF